MFVDQQVKERREWREKQSEKCELGKQKRKRTVAQNESIFMLYLFLPKDSMRTLITNTYVVVLLLQLVFTHTQTPCVSADTAETMCWSQHHI